MSPDAKIRKSMTAIKIDPVIGGEDLLLTIENTPEDRLDLLQQMTKLKLSLEKAHLFRNTNQ